MLLTFIGFVIPSYASQELVDKPEICKDNVFDDNSKDAIHDSYYGNQKTWKDFNNIYSTVKGRKLALFLDGTNNDANSATNIRILYRLAIANACREIPIIPYYDKGVGAHIYDITIGNAFGFGVGLNIRQAYHFLSRTYKDGDEIYIFGFSRGAFTARSLNGFIEFVGLLDATADNSPPVWWWMQGDEDIGKLYKQYKTKHDGTYNFEINLKESIAKYKEKEFQNQKFQSVKVNTIALFDTVPASGLFVDDEPDNHRLDLYANKGFHALSLDEQRDEFRLLRFNDLALAGNQKLDEVWFPGVHSDIGGGYSKEPDCRDYKTEETHLSKLSITPLNWLIFSLGNENLFMTNPSENTLIECRNGRLHDEFFDNKLFKRMGLSRRKPNRGDNIHISIVDRKKLNLCTKANTYREPDNKYNPKNLHSPIEDFYKIVGSTLLPNNHFPEPCLNDEFQK